MEYSQKAEKKTYIKKKLSAINIDKCIFEMYNNRY